MTAIAILHRDEIIEQVRQGMVLREIAPQYGVSKQAIHHALKDDPAYQAALPEQAEAMVEHAKEQTWAAREPVDIARAREITKFAFRYAESRDPVRWAPRSHVTIEHVQLGDRLRRSQERTIQALRQQGYSVCIAYSADDAIRIVKAYLEA